MGKGASQTQTQNSNTNYDRYSEYDIPQEVKDAWSRALGLAGGAADVGFVPQQGVPVADFSPDSKMGFNRIRDIADAGLNDPLNELLQQNQMDYLSQTGQPFDPSLLDQYMNPYTENVIDIGRERMLEDYEKQRQMLAGNKALSGSFGGSRHGIQEAQLAGENLRNMNEYTYGALQDNWNQAMNNYRQGQQMQLSGIGQGMDLSQRLRDQQVANASNLVNIGSGYEGKAQGALDFGSNEFMRGVNQPWLDATNYGNIAGNIGGIWGQLSPQHQWGNEQSTNTTTGTSQGSIFDQILGGAMAIGGLMSGNPLAAFGGMGGATNPITLKQDGGRINGRVDRSARGNNPLWDAASLGDSRSREGAEGEALVPVQMNDGSIEWVTPRRAQSFMRGVQNIDRGYLTHGYADGQGPSVMSYDLTPGGRGDPRLDNVNITYGDSGYGFTDPRIQGLYDTYAQGKGPQNPAYRQNWRDFQPYQDMFQNVQLMNMAGGGLPTGNPLGDIATTSAAGDSTGGASGDWIQDVFGGQENLDLLMQYFGPESENTYGIAAGGVGHNTPQGTTAYNPWINQLYGQSRYAAETDPEIYGPGGFNETRGTYPWASSGRTRGQGNGLDREARRARRLARINERRVSRGLNPLDALGDQGSFNDRFNRTFADGRGVTSAMAPMSTNPVGYSPGGQDLSPAAWNRVGLGLLGAGNPLVGVAKAVGQMGDQRQFSTNPLYMAAPGAGTVMNALGGGARINVGGTGGGRIGAQNRAAGLQNAVATNDIETNGTGPLSVGSISGSRFPNRRKFADGSGVLRDAGGNMATGRNDYSPWAGTGAGWTGQQVYNPAEYRRQAAAGTLAPQIRDMSNTDWGQPAVGDGTRSFNTGPQNTNPLDNLYAGTQYAGFTPQERTDAMRAADPNWNGTQNPPVRSGTPPTVNTGTSDNIRSDNAFLPWRDYIPDPWTAYQDGFADYSGMLSYDDWWLQQNPGMEIPTNGSEGYSDYIQGSQNTWSGDNAYKQYQNDYYAQINDQYNQAAKDAWIAAGSPLLTNPYTGEQQQWNPAWGTQPETAPTTPGATPPQNNAPTPQFPARNPQQPVGAPTAPGNASNNFGWQGVSNPLFNMGGQQGGLFGNQGGQAGFFGGQDWWKNKQQQAGQGPSNFKQGGGVPPSGGGFLDGARNYFDNVDWEYFETARNLFAGRPNAFNPLIQMRERERRAARSPSGYRSTYLEETSSPDIEAFMEALRALSEEENF